MNHIEAYKNEKSPIKRKAIAKQAYLEYFNDYLTVEKYAEHNECDEKEASNIIAEGKHWNQLPTIEEHK